MTIVKNSFCNNLKNSVGEEKDNSSLDTKEKDETGVLASERLVLK